MKKLLPALLLLLGTTIACEQQPTATTGIATPVASEPDTTAAQTQEAETVRVMQAMFDAFNRHDLVAMQALYADSAIFISPEMQEPVIGAHHVKTIYGPLFEMAPNVKDVVLHYIHNGDEVAVEFVSTGTVENIGPNDPAEMKGKNFELKIFARLKVKDGKIVEDISYFDQLAFLQQLGMMN
ncbi:nuclear transport factor 2 family protein [Pontibacter sp. Tf4]|uniref:nuclear transport factor 2 family protein n=1 Tax=Pontibacter sp. Tf4 TaxID=2761620 RepID=UPI00162A3532|nr:nuclear transport factor 2 family protein [Pontibacter sp. Tf4]MBB6610414.1 nuclear transport factor 2 family protein [Pontibacter sp. Tf4]